MHPTNSSAKLLLFFEIYRLRHVKLGDVYEYYLRIVLGYEIVYLYNI